MKSNYKILTTLFLLIILTAYLPSHGQIQDKKAEADNLMNEAANALKQKNFDEAIDRASRILELFPHSSEIYSIRAMAFQQKGEKQN